MTSGGMFEHEGSISPRDPHVRSSNPTGKSMVLDIDDIAPCPGIIDGRLCCADGAMCVQTLGGAECLRETAVAVVGPGPPAGRSVPAHMKIVRERLLPGSGCLAVRTVMDGPIRVLQITDVSQGSVVEATRNYQDWVVCEDQGAETEPKKDNNKSYLEICMSLKGGLGVSLVNHTPEELVYISLQNISLEYLSNPNSTTADISVASVQVDNQLFTATRPVLLYVTPTPSTRDGPDNRPALHVVAQKVPNSKWNAEIYKHLIVNMKKLSIQIEEQLLWKLLQFFGFGSKDHMDEKVTEEEDPRSALAAATSVKTKRYYFGQLKIQSNQINLSMLTASKLSPDLKALKRDMSLPLVKFEDAKVDLDPFVKSNLFETMAFLQKEIGIHYTEELKSQAAKILGSVDFLGNPLGLFNDVTEGISGLINDGNVGGLLKNVTHGVSNSAAKVVGSLSDGLETLNMDRNYQDRREQLKTSAQSSKGHLLAGVKGFGNGLFGAVTSIFTQPYDGFKEDGIEGFVTGLGKGVIGTVTKPVVGVLDLASGAANAIKDTSSSSSRISPPPVRLPRCCHGAGMLLPAYSKNQAKSQKLLHDLNKKNLDEFFIAVEQLRREDNLTSLITSTQVYFLLGGVPDSSNIILRVPHKDLFQCLVVENNGRYYLEVIRVQTPGADPQRVPQIRCDKLAVAERVSQQITYARNLYEEQQHTLTTSETEDSTYLAVDARAGGNVIYVSLASRNSRIGNHAGVFESKRKYDVTKPVVGVANAIKDTSSSSSRTSHPPVRLPRCCHGAGMLLPAYSKNKAKSQKLLHDLNKKNLDEFFIAVEQLRREDNLTSLITSAQVYFLLGGVPDSSNIILRVPHKDLFQCLVFENNKSYHMYNGSYYLEVIRVQTPGSDPQRVPQIRCDKLAVAERVMPYAWDEPMLGPSITLRVKGGTSATYTMDKLEEGKQLCYPNFIYLRASATFGRSLSSEGSDHRELVMEVVQDQYIKFCKKEIGNRNQLWRMTSGGMLEHEGSISPRDPHVRSSNPTGKSMVLDIDDIVPRPGRIVPLTLRKRDERRNYTDVEVLRGSYSV
uniref:Intermembrane lipid transfer protein VPS13-like C-terminal domain-containing protein n=1 Tax=Magallana gigas TaxID=29159 RepID=A0A8W8MIY9_MAGGI